METPAQQLAETMRLKEPALTGWPAAGWTSKATRPEPELVALRLRVSRSEIQRRWHEWRRSFYSAVRSPGSWSLVALVLILSGVFPAARAATHELGLIVTGFADGTGRISQSALSNGPDWRLLRAIVGIDASWVIPAVVAAAALAVVVAREPQTLKRKVSK